MIRNDFKYLFLTLFVGCFLTACKKDMTIIECDSLSELILLDPLKTKNKVIIIGIDGFRSDAMTQDITPFMYNLFSKENCYTTLSHAVEEDTYSGPNWSSILTGVHYKKHNVTDNSFEGSRFDKYPPFFDYIKRAIPDKNTASIVNWTPINENILSDYVDYAPIHASNDSLVFETTKNLLVNSHPIDADIIFIHFDELDAAGHAFGFCPNILEYRKTLNILDSYIENLLNIINNKRDSGDNWLFVVVSDHGGDGTGHGDASNPNINRTVLIAEHPSLEFKQNYTSNQTDIAVTILDFIGLSDSKFDCRKDGMSILQ